MTAVGTWPRLLLVAATWSALAGGGCQRDAARPANRGESAAAEAGPGGHAAAMADVASIRPQVEHFCGGCHAVPAPETFPRDAWYDEVKQGYDFYYVSQRTDLTAPPMQQVVSFYRSLAPARLDVPPPATSRDVAPRTFRREPISTPEGVAIPAVSHLRWWPAADPAGALLVCEMHAGDVRALSFPGGGPASPSLLARVPNPAHVEPTDLDGDGRTDFVVAVLGSFPPEDHDRGQVVWLRQRETGGQWDSLVLQDGLGRVADVQPADFNEDGRLDLVVAEFGWRRTGRILLLEQVGRSAAGDPQFETRVLDPRHGTIHVPVIDLNGDGHDDFVALVSQEHEVIEVFLGSGDGTFERETIFAAGDPSFGSSGIQLVDLDGDGDEDVLYTNGDTLDSHYVKPYHAIHWLENTGRFPFVPHELARMPGAFRAVAADLDGDGDRDIAACAYLPAGLRAAHTASHGEFSHDSLVWLEQRRGDGFVLHPLSSLNQDGFVALDIGDLDGDGDNDLAVGRFSSQSLPAPHSIDVWWNEDARPPPH